MGVSVKTDVVIVGAGPNGIACAVHLQRAGLRTVIVERGEVVDSFRRYPMEMRFSSTRERMTIAGFPFEASAETQPDGWPGAWPAEVNPTRDEAIGYYCRVAAEAGLDVRRGRRALALARAGGGFVVRTDVEDFVAEFVVIATGSFDAAARAGIAGEDLPHVSHFFEHGAHYAGRRVVVVGGTSSALEAALACQRYGARVTLVHRREGLYASPTFKSPPREAVAEAVRTGTMAAVAGARIAQIMPGGIRVTPVGAEERLVRIPPMNTSQAVPDPTGPIGALAPEHTVVRLGEPLAHECVLEADAVLLMTGYRADRSLLQGSGVAFASNGEPVWDRDTCESNVAGLYIVGAAGNPEGTGNRTGITSGLPQAARAMAALASRAAGVGA